MANDPPFAGVSPPWRPRTLPPWPTFSLGGDEPRKVGGGVRSRHGAEVGETRLDRGFGEACPKLPFTTTMRKGRDGGLQILALPFSAGLTPARSTHRPRL